MSDPISIGAVAGKVLVGKHIAESVVSGNDPSLLAVSALAFPSVKVPTQTPIKNGEHVIARKEVGEEVSSSNPNVREKVVLEKYVDSKYLANGNLEDAWSSLSNGELTFDSFLLAMVDIIDTLTFGVFKPQLLEIKINPHIKAREVIYRAEVAYDTPSEETVHSISEDGSKKQENIKIQKRITQVSKISFEISPEAFEKANLSFAESIEQIKSTDIADRTVIFARLDTLTEKDIKSFSSNGLMEINVNSQRFQSIETNRDLLAAKGNDYLDKILPNDKIVDDREVINSSVITKNTSNVDPLTDKQLETAGIKVHNQPDISAEQFKKTTAIQQEKINHLTHEHSIKSGIREEIATTHNVNAKPQNLTWKRETTRLREAVGEYDICELKNINVDDFVKAGAKLLSDKERVSDTIVAVDISKSGETLNLVDSSTKKSWLIKESNIRKEQATSTEKRTTRIAKQITDYDYLTNGKSILSANIETKKETATTVKDIVETKTHWNLFGWDLSGFLGKNITKEISPTVTTNTYENTVELKQGQDIFSNLNTSTEKLINNGGKLVNHANNVNTEHHEKITEHSFDEGYISKIPFIGGIGHLTSKSTLGGEVTKSDIFWASVDIASLILAYPTKGASLKASLAASMVKTAGKEAMKIAAKSLAKPTGKAVLKGTLHIAGKSTTKLASKQIAKHAIKEVGESVVTHGIEEGINEIYQNLGGKGKLPIYLGKNSIKHIGKISLKNIKQGVKSTTAKSGSIVRYKNIPKSNGVWKGTPGNSLWHPDIASIPKLNNPLKKTWGQILKENNLSKGIPYINGKIDLSKAARGSVTIKKFQLDRAKNFAQADSRFAKWLNSGHNINSKLGEFMKQNSFDLSNITKADIAKLRKLGYTWHERADMKTLDLISRDLHANLPHSGGISALKNQLTATNVKGVLN